LIGMTRFCAAARLLVFAAVSSASAQAQEAPPPAAPQWAIGPSAALFLPIDLSDAPLAVGVRANLPSSARHSAVISVDLARSGSGAYRAVLATYTAQYRYTFSAPQARPHVYFTVGGAGAVSFEHHDGYSYETTFKVNGVSEPRTIDVPAYNSSFWFPPIIPIGGIGATWRASSRISVELDATTMLAPWPAAIWRVGGAVMITLGKR